MRLFGERPRSLHAVLGLAVATGTVVLGFSWASITCFGQPGHGVPIKDSKQITVGGATIQVDFAEGVMDLPETAVLSHIHAATDAMLAYYGRFPVPKARILVIPAPGRHGDLHGTTWGDMGGWPGFTRIGIGENMTTAELADDWTMTHELVHMAFPSLADEKHWMEEGQATYIEPIARVMTGELKAEDIWRDMVHDMPKGEPQTDDQGLDHTHTWARTYWGGALFCLSADVEIRRETGNRKGLQDALRAVVAAGGTIDHEWDLVQALAIGDKATGTQVLSRMYAEGKDKPVTVDLPKLWQELGIRSTPSGGVEFDDKAPLANVRKSITSASQHQPMT
ncbi:MAG TPA: hypothetical protein VHZ28_13240 [Terracidiphilus sp.]|jgi:hypothetical protein|nr:hypothetical protein [Terracidiphilus sp.]